MRELLLAALLILIGTPSPAVIEGGESVAFDLGTSESLVLESDSTATTTFAPITYRVAALTAPAEQGLPDAATRSPASVSMRGNSALETDPFHVGMDKRPLAACTVYATLGKPEAMNGGYFRLFVRYSADGSLWTDWRALEMERDDAGKFDRHAKIANYRGLLCVPQTQRIEYNRYFSEWGRFRGDNADEYWEYLEEQHPDVLAREIPLIRYVQGRVEHTGCEPAVLSTLSFGTSWIVSGIKQ